jgi:hypothetical protein
MNFYHIPTLVRLGIVALALAFVACADPMQVAKRQQVLAAQQQAQFQNNIEVWLAPSPEGTSHQWQSDLNARSALSDLQKDALKDQELGVPMTANEQSAIATMTQEQKRAIARLHLMDTWVKQRSAEMQQQAQSQQALQFQVQQAEVQREQARLLCYQQMRTSSNSAFGPALAAEACRGY